MNKPIRTLSLVVMVLFVALLLNATYLQYVSAGSLNARPENARVVGAAFERERGAILVGRRPIAESVPSDGRYDYQREYPKPFVYAPVTGYFSYFSQTGVERTQNPVLSGDDSSLFVTRLLDMLSNSEPQGGSVALTIDPKAQEAAYSGLRALGPGVEGAVVALEPSSGKVLAMASLPSYDPNLLASQDLAASQEAYDRLLADDADPLINRATRTTLPPGSTFKLVTAAAAIESENYDADSLVPGGAVLDVPQTTDGDIRNEGGGTCGGSRITLTQALQVSCNVAFGALGLQLTDDELREQAEKFGFGQDYLPDLSPATAVSRFPEEMNDPQRAQSSIGQFDVAATPLQMAMVAAGIANQGDVMEPYLVDEVRSPDLQVLEKTEPQLLSTAVSPSTAEELTSMMVAVVDNGTGTNAQIPEVAVAGKTGTANSTPSRPPYAWFVSFAPADDPQVAVAVLVESSNTIRSEIAGGRLAAPIAKSVMEAVIE